MAEPTLKERAQAALEQQRGEVARLQAVADVELPAAQTQLAQLETLMKKWPTAMDDAIAVLKSAGVQIDA